MLLVVTALSRLQSAFPAWASTREDHLGRMVFTVPIVLNSGKPGRQFLLQVRGAGDTVSVGEQIVGHLLPKSCPERHINSDGSFCLGVDASVRVLDQASAEKWWANLWEYLQCQESADAIGIWPLGRAMSHGTAGHTQEEARSLASQLDLLDQYDAAVEFGEGWLASPWPLTNREGTRLLNGRLPCPRGCLSRSGKPRLRCECEHGSEIARLLFLERRRRREASSFVAEMKAKGFQCCGTMENCPFT